MWNAWRFLCCRVAGRHRWEPLTEFYRDRGWGCRDCGEVILEREFLEQSQEPEVKSPYWGRGGTSPPPD